MIILDCGSGNTCKNDMGKAKAMLDAIADLPLRNVVAKFQLFEDEPPNVPLDRDVFDEVYEYGTIIDVPVTASVFDISSLIFYQYYETLFTKIANKPNFYYLGRLAKNPVIISVPVIDLYYVNYDTSYPLCCVSMYPAEMQNYENRFNEPCLSMGISDHTVGLDLYHKYKPVVWEKHFALERDPDNLDSGPFAVTPKDLEEL